MSRNTDIFVSGGGIAGLTAALTLSRLGLSVTLADPSPPP
ncbi:MAG: NAD(P)-binding protein, partial [Silicimonas sp.]|nr:NAD(P)-binding protein [Silicimonas sp.]